MKKMIKKRIIIFITVLVLCTGCGKNENKAMNLGESSNSHINLAEEETEPQVRFVQIEEETESDSVISEIPEESDVAEDIEREIPEPLWSPGPSETGSRKTDNAYYAIYPSVIEEDGPQNTSEQYAVCKKTIHVTFPQIYYWNEHYNFGSEIESGINQEMFLLSIDNNKSFLFERDISGLQQCTTDYMITKADSDLFSVVFTEQFITLDYTENTCRGITVGVSDGTVFDLSEYATLGTDLVSQVEDGTIEFVSEEYEWSDVSEDVVRFEKDYKVGSVDTVHCYYLEGDDINLIIPLNRKTGGYVILRLPIS